ncbi:pRL2-19 [Streptomyces albidoflavus]
MDTPRIPATVTPSELSHAVLLALLAFHGELSFPLAAMAPARIGTPDGTLHALGLETRPGGMVRLTIQPRPDTPGAAITWL